MGTYTYKCSACGEVFDIKATVQEKEAGKKFACLKCGSQDIKQEFSAVNFIKNVFTGEKKNCCSGDNGCADDGEPAGQDSDENKKHSCGCCG